MKKILTLTAIFFISIATSATNYYVSTSGSDAAAGTSPAAAWKTLAKVNAFTFAANDSILLKRGDVFYGAINVNRNNINIDAYGTGARPVITGFTGVSSFAADVMPGVWKAAVNAKSNLILVTINNIPQQIGRYPNSDAANGGYLTYEVSDTAADYIADGQLTSFPNWTGADVAMRGNDWTIDRGYVLKHTGGNIFYSIKQGINSQVTPKFSIIKPGYGYFFFNDKRTLDKPGEWWFNPNVDSIYVFTGGAAPSNVKVATIDTLINCSNKTFVSVKNIDFEGTNVSAVFSLDGSNVTVKDCSFTNMGAKAIFFYRTGNALVENCNVYNCLSNAIQVSARTKNNVTVRGCTIKNNALLKGMGSYYDYSDNKTIVVQATSGVLCENNRIDSCALAGIDFNGSDVLVQNNVVLHFCINLHDEGAVYTFVDPTSDSTYITKNTNRVVKNNLVMYGYGDSNGTPDSSNSVAGLYLDGKSPNVTCTDNTVAFIGKNGAHTNNFWNITFYGNTFYNVLNGISSTKWSYANVSNLVCRKNIFVQVRNTDNFYIFQNTDLNKPTVDNTYDNYLKSVCVIDSNYYYGLNDLPVDFGMSAGGKPVLISPKSIANFTAITGFDKNAVTLRQYKAYKITSLIGSNLVSNGTFNTSVTGWTLSGSNTNFLWNAGTGRMSFFTPAPTKTSFIWAPAGAVSISKKYVLRFTTAGVSYGNLQAYMRSRTTYKDIITRQDRSFGSGTKLHEFLLNGPVTTASAAACIAVDQGSNTTSIDNIELYECNATINNIGDSVTFLSNTKATPDTVKFNENRTDAKGSAYKGSAIVPSHGSLVLFFNSNITTVISSKAFLTRKRK